MTAVFAVYHLVYVGGEKFSALTIDGNNIGKIFFP